MSVLASVVIGWALADPLPVPVLLRHQAPEVWARWHELSTGGLARRFLSCPTACMHASSLLRCMPPPPPPSPSPRSAPASPVPPPRSPPARSIGFVPPLAAWFAMALLRDWWLRWGSWSWRWPCRSVDNLTFRLQLGPGRGVGPCATGTLSWPRVPSLGHCPLSSPRTRSTGWMAGLGAAAAAVRLGR